MVKVIDGVFRLHISDKLQSQANSINCLSSEKWKFLIDFLIGEFQMIDGVPKVCVSYYVHCAGITYIDSSLVNSEVDNKQSLFV